MCTVKCMKRDILVADLRSKGGLSMKTGLLLEGGGMRGMFTAGILDRLMEEGITFDYAIGSSSGGVNVMNFVSGQNGRSRKLMERPKGDNYCGKEELFRTGKFLNLDKMYGTYLYREDLRFDFEAYFASKTKAEYVVSNCHTGKPEYLSEKKDEIRLAEVGKASCSLPLVCGATKLDGKMYMDGSMTDPIPVQHCFDEGCDRVLIISTKGEGMEPSNLGKMGFLMRLLYGKKCKPFIESCKNRLSLYYKQWEQVYELEKAGKVFLMQPQGAVAISHLETDQTKLLALYEEGYAYATQRMDEIKSFVMR